MSEFVAYVFVWSALFVLAVWSIGVWVYLVRLYMRDRVEGPRRQRWIDLHTELRHTDLHSARYREIRDEIKRMDMEEIESRREKEARTKKLKGD